MKTTTTTTTTTEPCPLCKGTGDAYRAKAKGQRYWYPCPICNGGRKAPDMKRYKELLKEGRIEKPKKGKK